LLLFCFFFQAEDGIRDRNVTGVQTCALPIYAYIENNEMPFFRYAMLSYTNCKKVENLDAVIGKEPVCKIAVYDAIAAAEHCIKEIGRASCRERTENKEEPGSVNKKNQRKNLE